MEEDFEDILKESGLVEPEKKQEESIEEYRSRLAKLEAANEKMSSDYRELRSQYDTTKDRFGKTIGYLEGAGLAKFDRETGEIHRIDSSEQSINPDKLEKEISKETKNLEKQFKDGDIDHEEFLNAQKEIDEKKEQLIKLRIESQYKEKEPAVNKESQTDNVDTEYKKIGEQYRDIYNPDSTLFKEMQKIYNEDPNYWSKGNPSGGKNPKIYAELAEKANQRLLSSDKYDSPRGQGYKTPGKQKSYLSKEQTSSLIAAGFSNTNLLKDINNSIGRWESSGEIQMEY